MKWRLGHNIKNQQMKSVILFCEILTKLFLWRTKVYIFAGITTSANKRQFCRIHGRLLLINLFSLLSLGGFQIQFCRFFCPPDVFQKKSRKGEAVTFWSKKNIFSPFSISLALWVHFWHILNNIWCKNTIISPCGWNFPLWCTFRIRVGGELSPNFTTVF